MTARVGIDIGSRTIKLVLLEDGQISRTFVTDTTFDPLAVCRDLLAETKFDQITATGYGRHLFARHWSCDLVSEIKAVGLGSRYLLPTCSTVLDVGGQDTKAVALDTEGRLHKFLMNDRCAAGTGRFLELMATALSFTYEQFAEAALSATHAEKLSSMCTVFAESEAISLVAQGASREAIALGIHQAMATRTLSLLRGIPLLEDIVFAGGGALNACLHQQIEAGLGKQMYLPEHPQIVAALGAALGNTGKEKQNDGRQRDASCAQVIDAGGR